MTALNPFEDFVAKVREQLTEDERAGAVAYAPSRDLPFAEGTALQLPHTDIQVNSSSWLAFIDRDPMANWGHAARYLLIDCVSGVSASFETRFPPFNFKGGLQWRVIYKAPSIPDAAVAGPQ
jgi:hypothetical protein